MGAGRLEQLWPELEVEHQINVSGGNYIKQGHIKHHFTESAGTAQAAALINMLWNRDPMCHTHTNFTGNGLPLALRNEIFNDLFGPFPGSGDAIDGATPTAVNQAKVVFGYLSIIYLELHNSMTLCNYTLPGWASPLKSRNYRGDIDIEAKFFTAVTGETVTRADMEKTGLRILTLFRALTARLMNERDMRNNHDQLPEWSFHAHSGSTTLDRADMEIAKDMFYDLCGWDRTTGLPTLATYNSLGLGDVATAMAAAGLMPS